MRWCLVLVLCAPSAAFAQDEFEDAAELLDEDNTWTLDDGLGEETPWDDYDRAASYGPPGLVHLGVQLRVAALPGGRAPLPDGPLFDSSAFLDLRYTQRGPLHFRVAIAFTFQNFAERNGGGGRWEASSPFSIRLRIYPLALDITDWIAVRAAVDVGAQWARRLGSDAGEIIALASVTGEAALRLLEGFLEIGVVVGFQTTGIGVSMRGNLYGHETDLEWVVGGTAGWMVL